MKKVFYLSWLLLLVSCEQEHKHIVTWKQMQTGVLDTCLAWIYNKPVKVSLNENELKPAEYRYKNIPNGTWFKNYFLFSLPRDQAARSNFNQVELHLASDKWLYSFWKPKKVTYLIASPCDTIDKIVLQEIRNELRRTLQSKVDNADLGVLFQTLKAGRLKEFLNMTNPVANDTFCTRVMNFLDYVKSGDQSGFGRGETEIQPPLSGYLDEIAATLRHLTTADSMELEIKIVGYTDPVPVTTEKITHNDSIFYNSTTCGGDKTNLLQYVNLQEINPPGFTEVPNIAKNNCQLSAIRSHHAAIYLRDKINDRNQNHNIKIAYAAGGQFPENVKDGERRKITVLIKVLSGTAPK